MEILGKILGGAGRVKMMRLFLLNRNKSFVPKDIALRCRIGADTVRKELKLYSTVGFVRRKGEGWQFDPSFRYREELERLLITSNTLDKDAVLESFKKTGKVKLLLASGIFIKNRESRVDLLIVGDKLKKSKIEEAIRRLEAEIGMELTYALFETKEFSYRLSMYDKLVRDILDFPHEVVWQAKELSTQALKKS